MSVSCIFRRQASRSEARRGLLRFSCDFVSRKFVAFAALLYFTIFAYMYIFARGAYFSTIEHYQFGVWKYPFLDFEAIPAALECWSRGINVYVNNPCDSLGRSGVYSPIWLWLPVLPTGAWWTGFYGTCIALGLCVALTVLPPVGGLRNRLILLAAVVSPHVVFAVERANSDVIIFIGTAIFLLLYERSPQLRIASYALALLLGLMKWYPMTVLALALRERLRIFLAVATISFIAFGMFIGGLGGLLPAVRASRMEIIAAVKRR